MSVLNTAADLMIMGIVLGILWTGHFRKVPVFDAFMEGGKEGIDVMVRLLPPLVGMVVAIGMLRASGFFDLLARGLSPLFNALHVPTDLLPLMLVRPFSGQASNAVLVDIIQRHGGDAWVSKVAATMIGSTETTFYVIAVYFGVVAIRRHRHAIACGLIADASGMIAALLVCAWLL